MSRDTPPRRGGVLVVRPEPALTETRETLERQGWLTWGMESLIVSPHTLPLQTGIAGVLITSSQALPALAGSVSRDVPIYAVGDATAARISALDFPSVISASGNAAQLADLIKMQCSPAGGPLLLLSGQKQGLDLASSLRVSGFQIRRRVAYSTMPAHSLPPDTLRALHEKLIGTVMVFSTASARAFCSAFIQSGGSFQGLRGITISENSSKELRKNGFGQTATAATPDMRAMIDLLEHYGKSPSQP
ncbi:uroporphyrinogen-III synthase [Acetobacter conturbans]|uniref:Uroporphyrinogen-III synthase n=1 Tax=Acetobacter conturbans TaxID=1737472 RepID=A0ABX0K3L7_9PROT|nr:uroporphyrinogen-III synthase [Acetobacter conturbans]NHN89230.1 uroporphyrinogen-III synthase [Acetobacter conturbans]